MKFFALFLILLVTVRSGAVAPKVAPVAKKVAPAPVVAKAAPVAPKVPAKPAAPKLSPEEQQVEDLVKAVLAELKGVEDGYAKSTGKLIADETAKVAAENKVKGLKPVLKLEKEDDTSENNADALQDFGDLDDDMKELVEDMKAQLKDMKDAADRKAAMAELKEEAEEIVDEAKEVAEEQTRLVEQTLYDDLKKHLKEEIKQFYASSTEAPKKAPEAPAKPVAAKPAAPAAPAKPVVAEPAKAAPAKPEAPAKPVVAAVPKVAEPAKPVVKAPAKPEAVAAKPVVKAPAKPAAPAKPVVPVAKKVAAVKAYAEDSSSGSIFSALLIIGSVISAAGATLYFIGNPKYQRNFMTSGSETELDRLFVSGQSYYQSV